MINLNKCTIIYDGQCPYCCKQISRFQNRDHNRSFNYRAKQEEILQPYFPQLNEERYSKGLRLIDQKGHVYVDADALYHIVKQLRGYRLLAWVYQVPGLHWLCKKFYTRLNAANR